MELHFFIGKGGVGKSTVSALSALSTARSGGQALLVSMDPAHNQQDIFGLKFGDQPRRVRPGLRVSQVDSQNWLDGYLKDTGKAIQRAYSYQGAYNLSHTFDILRLSPGLEAYGLVLAFEQILEREDLAEAVYFDMPPTARTLDFFSLPSTTLAWLEALLRLRESIQFKKKIITRIKSRRDLSVQDRVQAQLDRMIQKHLKLKALLSRACLHLVMNPEPLSLAESVRLQARLKTLGYTVSRLALNKALAQDLDLLKSYALDASLVQIFPPFQGHLTGLGTLDNYLTGVWQPAFRPFHDRGPKVPLGSVLGN